MRDVHSELKAFGLRLRMARDRMGVSQDALSQRLGVDANLYGKWERGHVAPRMLTLVRVCDAMDVSMDWLCGRVAPVSRESPKA